jgi:exopolysaccharide biosynthesis polyprenyl glycosylphosphotransferase
MRQYLFSYSRKRQRLLLIGDMLIIAISIFISYTIRVYLNQKNPSLAAVISKMDIRQVFVLASHLFTLYLLNQYNLNRLLNPIRSSVMLIVSVFMAGLIISGILFFFPKYIFGRQVLIIHLVVVSFFIVLWRRFFTEVIVRNSQLRRLAVIGDRLITSSFIDEMSAIPNSGFEISDVCLQGETNSVTGDIPDTVHRHDGIQELIESEGFDVLTLDSTSGSFTDEEIRNLLQLRYRGKAVYDLPTLYRNITGKVPLPYIDGRWLLSSDGLQGETSKPYARAKRTFDVLLSLLLLILSAPLFVIISILIRLDSKGKVFFIQERLGMQRKPFGCIKFRTMIEDAEKTSGPVWTAAHDPRVTRIGKWLRKSRLDELPQLWNVLKGEMSFVGPRPIREHFAKQLAEKIPYYGIRFDVKPGLTGWAQVNYDYAGSELGQLEKFQYELFYIQHMSLFLDILTVIRTVKQILKGGGH